ncbi:MAG TPA: 1-acyl-sn-glycerol-3-phosphate acyltransferase [Bacteroidales bacterium]|nr:1-acyl-sn-glycerol-3-phosphate acyltransferase [Bacteroidales bacterium]HOU96594.1 1-acyl-sn-glycerol-3-phosphate acyltransferase [Bacteroidales bacterium]HQG36780.1 1-acyl-sn-glycerol-3-phosphate acyltransferase [Bacteroidales bacterium]HQG53499.1 1-acyl-sn-glycerol-3-phosphate acyltransferase [Bacteroidales bacterium]HQJ21052.1 1-acyl-sn-glycerol-3-phosphate acyltransferase [Bacteroidales bacterium]
MYDSSSQGYESYSIDVKEVLRSKNPSLARIVPPFLINYLKRIVHQDELNEFLRLYGHLKGAEFIKACLDYMNIIYTVTGRENIPKRGRFIFVSNHPLGGLDGLVFIYELSKYFKNLKFPVNDILLNIRNLDDIFLPVNKHGSQPRDAVKAIDEAYASSCQILYFPAGLCSRKKRGVIKDLTWQKNFITKAITYKRDVVPAYFSGRNSNFFYNLANLRTFLGIKANIEMLYLADEMFHQKGKKIHLAFGQKIPWETFDKSKTPAEWAEWVKSKTYELEPLTRDNKSI